jgi:phosphoribosyl 1,2-cyclic phosphate phosphodiesterase
MELTTYAKFLFLGTGASSGVPVIGCDCHVCKSANSKNYRLRASAYITYEDKAILIDAGPDIRQQVLKYNIRKLDGLIITHTHYDHIGGLEEMRAFNFLQQRPMPCLVSRHSMTEIRKLFYYLFRESGEVRNFTANFQFHSLEKDAGHVNFQKLEIEYFPYRQGEMTVFGYRFGDLAYVTDIKEYPESTFDHLKGLSTLIISALRFTPSALQFSIDEAIDFAERVGAKQTYLMHLSHDVEYEHMKSLLPKSMNLAYDGLEIPFHAPCTNSL